MGLGGSRGEVRPPPASSTPLGILDRPAQLSSSDGKGALRDPPPTRPTVGVRPPAGLVVGMPFIVLRS